MNLVGELLQCLENGEQVRPQPIDRAFAIPLSYFCVLS